MQILENYKVPTGNILVVQGERGKLEMLSLGDYGKNVNVVAPFMGLDREIKKVEHTTLLPLEEKWVITVSTQYGCSMGCKFCDVPKVGKGVNATYNDLMRQVETGIALHPEVKQTKRLNVHFARMGEPTFNQEVLLASIILENNFARKSWGFHPVVSTMMPKANKNLTGFIEAWMDFKNNPSGAHGNAGLQLSINSTSDEERDKMFGSCAMLLSEIGRMFRRIEVVGRKITLNFAVAGYETEPQKLLDCGFDPERFLIKLTPMHKTREAIANGIKTDGDYTEMYPYVAAKERLEDAGYDVLVFIASEYEDMGRITCGNAILSGTKPEVPYTMEKI